MFVTDEELRADAAEQKQEQAKKLSLEEVVALAEQLKEYEAAIITLEDQLQFKKEVYRELSEKTLPEAFHILGINSLSLKSGETIGLQEMIGCSITEENRAAAHSWLRENGFGDIIKNQVTVEFGKEEDEKAREFASTTALESGGLVSLNEKVHPSTLKAFVKERLKNGDAIPAEAFKLYVGVAARVNQPKKGK